MKQEERDILAFDAFMKAIDNPKPPTQAERSLLAAQNEYGRSRLTREVPNRLLGARVLENGDCT